jgi:hypothetical protein
VLNQIDLAPCDGCDACGLRCAAGVQMTQAEYRQAVSWAEAPANRTEVQRVVAQDKTVDLGDGVTVRMCRYREMDKTNRRGGCAIYPARPLICRLLGHVEWMPCPIGAVPKQADTVDALALMRAYAAEPRRTFEDWDEIREVEKTCSS